MVSSVYARASSPAPLIAVINAALEQADLSRLDDIEVQIKQAVGSRLLSKHRSEKVLEAIAKARIAKSFIK
jgi:hypothetical protein